MKSLISALLIAVSPFFAALFLSFVFVRLLGFGFVDFSNWYVAVVVGIQALIALGMIGLGLQQGQLDAIPVNLLRFFAMSLLLLAGMSVFQLWQAVPLAPKAFSVVANYQNEVVRLTGLSIDLGYDPQFQSSLQREVALAIAYTAVSLVIDLFRRKPKSDDPDAPN